VSPYEFIAAEKASFTVRAMCRALEVSRTGFYAYRKRPASERAAAFQELTHKVVTVYEESGRRYGSPRVTKQLRDDGVRVSRKTVEKAMRQANIRARARRRFVATTDSRETTRIAPNLLERDFTAERPNEVWVTDVTALPLRSGWVYLAVIIDLFGRRVVGWAMSTSNDTELALSALRRAVATRQPRPGLIHHSDRGSPYGADAYIAELDAIGAVRSMSRKGDCWDNAVAESFFSTLEFECIDGCTFDSLLQAHAAVANYIDGFYNPRRLHSTLGLVSPIEFETRSALLHEAA